MKRISNFTEVNHSLFNESLRYSPDLLLVVAIIREELSMNGLRFFVTDGEVELL